jgi:DNA-binding LacI/PurR family transcriptional regulator
MSIVRRATLKDVAAHAGVSPAAVSKVVRGAYGVSAQMDAKVRHSIELLGYTTNAGARALVTSRSNVIGLSVPFREEEFVPATLQFVLAVSQTARLKGYDVLLVTPAENDPGIERVTQGGMVDGMIVLDLKQHDTRLSPLMRSATPTVLIGAPEDSMPLDSVDVDFTAAAGLLVRHLHERGHRSVILLALPEVLFEDGLGYARRFRAGAIEAARSLGVRLRIVYAAPTPSQRYREIKVLLHDRGDASAVIIHNDGALVDFPAIIRDLELSVPSDLSIVSIFPREFGQIFSVPYTSVEASSQSTVQRAVDLLTSRINGSELPYENIRITPTLIDHHTVESLLGAVESGHTP